MANNVQAATGDVGAVRVRADGWSADIDIANFISTSTTNNLGYGANNDPTNARIVFSVTSPGFDASGNATTITRTVYGTKIVRLPYPNQNSLNVATTTGIVTIRVALSDFIYSGDTSITTTMASGWYTDDGTGGTGLPNNSVTALAVTNNSTLSYPKVIGRWAWPGYERVTGDFLVEAVAFNRFARNGKPVAAVVFSAADQHGNIAYATTTAMTKTTRTGDANIVQVYAATIPVASLTQSDALDINFIAYPWVGDSTSILNSTTTADGVAQPSELFGPLSGLNDKDGTYGVAYAYVSTTTGVDASGTVYTSQSAAEAGNAYKTIEKAAEGIKAYNTANFSRTDPGGGVILVAEGTYQYPGASSATFDTGTMKTWLIIKPASTALKANTIINANALNASFKASRVKIEGFTISGPTTSLITGRQATDVLWLHNNEINATSAQETFAYFRTSYATQNSITALTAGLIAYGGYNPFSLIRGNIAVNPTRSSFYVLLGNKNITGAQYPEYNSNFGAVSDNAIFAYNSIYNLTSASLDWAQTSRITKGIAIVNNVFETQNSTTYALVEVGATSNAATTTNNILFWHNTLSGERENVAYLTNNDENFDKLNWSNKFNIFHEWNIKTDTFAGGTGGANGARIGNWPATYNLGSLGNISEQHNFPGDWNGLSTIWASGGSDIPAGFVNDASIYGTGSGNGNYALVATSSIIDIATSTDATNQVLPFDFLGNSVYGSPDSGAIEYQPPYTMGTNPIATSSIIRMYGDEKWRARSATTTAGTASLNITMPGSDTTNWLDISVSLWDTAGNYQKTWTEMSSTTGLTNTVHVVGDLVPSANYNVSLDGVVGTNITGASCTSGVCTANGSGQITFTYTGTYSAHTFDVSQSTDTAPTVSVTAPSNGSTVAGASVVLSASASDDVAVAGVQFKLDSTTNIGSEITVAPYNLTWNSTSVSDASHTISAVARDSANNYATSTITVTVNNVVAEATPTVVVTGSSSGGSSGSSVIRQIMLSTATTTANTLTANCSTTTYSIIANNLSEAQRSTGIDVVLLQKILVLGKYLPEVFATGIYDTATTKAVQSFQREQGIIDYGTPNTTGFGNVGPRTRAILNSNITKGTYTVLVRCPASVSYRTFTRSLKLGSIGPDVKALQVFLNNHNAIVAKNGAGSPGNETDYFGPATEGALKKFQEANRNKILKPAGLTNPTGFFGEFTIKVVNEMI